MQAVEVMFGYQITLTEELASRFDYLTTFEVKTNVVFWKQELKATHETNA